MKQSSPSLEPVLSFETIVLLFFVLGVKWWTIVSSNIFKRCKNSALLLWNLAKHSIETSLWHCFCSSLSKCSTHLAHNFLMFKFLNNMRCATLFEIPKMSISSCTFSRRLSTTAFVDILNHFWSRHLIWSTTVVFVLAARTALFKLSYPKFY